MQHLLDTLHSLDARLAGAASEVFGGHAVSLLSDAQVLEITAVAAQIARRAEALLIESAAEIEERCSAVPHAERLTTTHGCRSVSELLQRVTRCSGRTVAGVITASRAVVEDVALSSGERLPAEFPRMRDALAAGAVGVDGMLAIVQPLARTVGTAGRAAHIAADEELSAVACGEGMDAAPPACADDLRAQATVWAMYLDQDGAEPREGHAMRKRGVTLGRCAEGLVPMRGNLLPEVAAQLQRIFDSILNPKGPGAPLPAGPVFVDSDSRGAGAGDGAGAGAGGDFDGHDERGVSGHDGDDSVYGYQPREFSEPCVEMADDRTRPQQQHDAFAAALTKVAGSGALPTIGGAAPTLIVSVRQSDLDTNRGFAHINGCDEPVSLSLARHIACSGSIERATVDDNGRVVSLMSFDRVFTHHQRKAITLRDGGCVIPGCHVTADWCEIHHVEEHSRGGPTHLDNGVMLCWFHHRTLDTSGWHVRMKHGIPEVKGPFWWDSHIKWRPVTKSPTRMRERVARRN
ncbi:DUF222 domain-containing protein (plasmid) [Coraliomargarita sp. W4R53]